MVARHPGIWPLLALALGATRGLVVVTPPHRCAVRPCPARAVAAAAAAAPPTRPLRAAHRADASATQMLITTAAATATTARMRGECPHGAGRAGAGAYMSAALLSRARAVINVAVLGSMLILVARPIGMLCFGLDMVGKLLKLSWRLMVLSFVLRTVGKAAMGPLMQFGLKIMMAGGPIKATKLAFFGTLADLFGGIAAFLAGRGPLDGIASFFGNLARGCDDRCPSRGTDAMDNGFGAAFGGGSGGGMGGGGNPFDMGGGDAGDVFGGLFGDAPMAPPSTPVAPFKPSASAPGVTVRVRAKGAKSPPPPPPPSPPPAPTQPEADES